MAEVDCTEALQELYGFLDGVLDDDKRTSIGAHLDECGPCLGIFDFQADLRRVVASKAHDEVPDSLRERIARMIADAD